VGEDRCERYLEVLYKHKREVLGSPPGSGRPHAILSHVASPDLYIKYTVFVTNSMRFDGPCKKVGINPFMLPPCMTSIVAAGNGTDVNQRPVYPTSGMSSTVLETSPDSLPLAASPFNDLRRGATVHPVRYESRAFVLGVTDRLAQFRLRYGLAHLEFFRDSQFLADNRSAEAAPSARGRRRRVRGNNIEVHFENVCDVQGLEATARNSVGSLPINHPK
jgi:hypothetical protein